MRFSKFAGNKPVCKSTDLKRKSAFLLWDTPYFILYSSLFLQKYPMFDEQVNYNLETPIRVLPDKYKTCLWEVLKLYGASTTFESEMYNICMKDVLFYSVLLYSYFLHSAAIPFYEGICEWSWKGWMRSVSTLLVNAPFDVADLIPNKFISIFVLLIFGE